MILQSMDNQVVTFGARDRFRQNKKKTFKGHMCAGYACGLDVSPDGHYVISGDGNGFLVIWDWKSTKRYAKIKAHDDVCIGVRSALRLLSVYLACFSIYLTMLACSPYGPQRLRLHHCPIAFLAWRSIFRMPTTPMLELILAWQCARCRVSLLLFILFGDTQSRCTYCYL